MVDGGGQDAGDAGAGQPGDECDDNSPCRAGLFCNDFGHCVDETLCTDTDTDGDGICDTEDSCPGYDDILDSDSDGQRDDCDPCPDDNPDDADSDLVCDSDDNCPDDPNAVQTDADSDGQGDVCDDDDDGDGVDDEVDNCPLVSNPGQADADSDAVGDACEGDQDGDGVLDDADNCPAVANSDQADAERDGIGDVCDPDDDNDTVPDAGDSDPLDPSECADADSDGCDDVSYYPDGEWLGPGWYRFIGDAGVQMPESPPTIHSCGTHAPGWLNGTHPTVFDGLVTRQVCFHWSADTCNWSADIQIVNCGTFYLYNLADPLVCRLRYCGSDVTAL